MESTNKKLLYCVAKCPINLIGEKKQKKNGD